MNGLIDLYYQVDPRNSTVPITLVGTDGVRLRQDLGGRAFDLQVNALRLNLFELNFAVSPSRRVPLGFDAKLTAGDTATVVHLTEPGGTGAWQSVQQLYVTVPFGGGSSAVNVDAGIFVTPFGNEVIESSGNDAYSRGLLFTYAIPFYHAGLRFTSTSSSHVAWVAELVNGWNDIADDNGAKSVIGQITYTFNPAWNLTVGAMDGDEGEGIYGPLVPKGKGAISTQLYELLAGWSPKGRLRLNAELDLGAGAGSDNGRHVSGSWDGVAVFGHYALGRGFALALRGEQFDDNPGVGSLAGPGGAGGLRVVNGATRLREATLTLEYARGPSGLLTRLEVRHDHANSRFFPLNANGGARDQDTVTLAEIYRF
ncbi:MAG: outer membrane beta-barrel protein [Armatimonadetes bacterium]|nr:outer membrane beta-barrel protein [Armatimonadota bacterium]